MVYTNAVVSMKSPHTAARWPTIATWLTRVIALSGQRGSLGSVRAGAASRAAVRGATLTAVLEAGDWAQARTYRQFYFKPGPLSFSESVLS